MVCVVIGAAIGRGRLVVHLEDLLYVHFRAFFICVQELNSLVVVVGYRGELAALIQLHEVDMIGLFS